MSKLNLPLYSVIIASFAMVSCNTAYQYAPVAHVQPSAVAVDSYAAKESLVPFTAHNRGGAISFCRAKLNAVAPAFSVELQYGNPAAEMSAIAQDLLDTGLAVAMEMESTGSRVVFTPEYSDCVLMLRAHRSPAYIGTLAPATQKALSKAQQIVAQVCGQYETDYERAVALHDYIALNTRYESRLGIAAQADATTKLLNEGVAVCDGYAHTYGLLLSMAGIENQFVVGKGDDVEHIWNLVKLNGSWTHVDVTYDDPKPDKPGRILHSYFGASDARIATNHQWKRADFPKATVNSLFHPTRMGHHFASVQEMLYWAATQRVGYPWSVTVYVDELQHLRSESAAHAKLQSAATAMGVDKLRSVALDKGSRGSVYCSFSY